MNIVARKIYLTICNPYEPLPTDLMLSFWRRVANRGHFEELAVVFDGLDGVVPACVVPEEIRAVLANNNLKVLRLDTCMGVTMWGPHIETLFNGSKDHKELCTLQIDAAVEDFGPGFRYLRKLLLHHKNVTVLDSFGDIVTDRL